MYAYLAVVGVVSPRLAGSTMNPWLVDGHSAKRISCISSGSGRIFDFFDVMVSIDFHFSANTGFVRAKLGHFDGYQVNAYNKGCMEAALRVISTRFSRCTSLAKTQANADASEERVH